MLVPIIFIVALMVTLATAMLENGLAAARGALHTTVARYSDVAISDGVADFTAGLAGFVQQNGARGPWPGATSESFTRSLCDARVSAAQCPFSYTVRGTITDAAGGAAADTNVDTALNLQTSVIAEGRVSAVVTATITGSNGKIFGTRSRQLTYRVFEAAPYAVVSGSRDMAAVDGARRTAQGDSGGAAGGPIADASSSAAGPDATPAAAQDTRIHVQLACSNVIKNLKPNVNDQQLAGNDGLPWGNMRGAAHETLCHAAASNADAFANGNWTNGNANASGWTQ